MMFFVVLFHLLIPSYFLMPVMVPMIIVVTGQDSLSLIRCPPIYGNVNDPNSKLHSLTMSNINVGTPTNRTKI